MSFINYIQKHEKSILSKDNIENTKKGESNEQ
jgi:hypothetical protein